MRLRRDGKQQKNIAVTTIAMKGETALKGNNMNDEQFEKLHKVLSAIAYSLHYIELHQKTQVELLNGGFGFVKDISEKSDAGGAVYELMDSFDSKMQELINVITRK